MAITLVQSSNIVHGGANGHINNGSAAFSDPANGLFNVTDTSPALDIDVNGAGSGGTRLSTTITGFTNTTSVTLAASNASGGNLTTAQYVFGLAHGSFNGTTAFTYVVPGAVTAGDLLAIGINTDPSLTISSVTDNSGSNSWTKTVPSGTNGFVITANYYQQGWVCTNAAAASAGGLTITITLSGTPADYNTSINFVEFTGGVAGTWTIHKFASAVDNTGTSSAVNSGNVTTTIANCAMWGWTGVAHHVNAVGGGNTSLPTTNQNNGSPSIPNDPYGDIVFYQIASSTNTFAGSATESAAGNWGASYYAFGFTPAGSVIYTLNPPTAPDPPGRPYTALLTGANPPVPRSQLVVVQPPPERPPTSRLTGANPPTAPQTVLSLPPPAPPAPERPYTSTLKGANPPIPMFYMGLAPLPIPDRPASALTAVSSSVATRVTLTTPIAPLPPEWPATASLAGVTQQASANGIMVTPDPLTAAPVIPAQMLAGVSAAASATLLRTPPQLPGDRTPSNLIAGANLVTSSSANLVTHLQLPGERTPISLLIGANPPIPAFLAVTVSPLPPDRPASAMYAGVAPPAATIFVQVPGAPPVGERPATLLEFVTPPAATIPPFLSPFQAPAPPERPASTWTLAPLQQSAKLPVPFLAPPLAERPFTQLAAGGNPPTSGTLLHPFQAPESPDRPPARVPTALIAGATQQASSSINLVVPDPRTPLPAPTTALYQGIKLATSSALFLVPPTLPGERTPTGFAIVNVAPPSSKTNYLTPPQPVGERPPATALLPGFTQQASFAGVIIPVPDRTAAPAPAIGLLHPAATLSAASSALQVTPKQVPAERPATGLLFGTNPTLPLALRAVLQLVGERAPSSLVAGVSATTSSSSLLATPPQLVAVAPLSALLAGATVTTSSSANLVVPDPRTPLPAPFSALLAGYTLQTSSSAILPTPPQLPGVAPYSALVAGYVQAAAAAGIRAPFLAPPVAERPYISLLAGGTLVKSSSALLSPSIAPPVGERPGTRLLVGFGDSGRNYLTVVAQPIAERPPTNLIAGVVGPGTPIYALAPSIAPLPPERPATGLLAGSTALPTAGTIVSPFLAPPVPLAPPSELQAGFNLTASGVLIPVPVAPPVAERPYSAFQTGFIAYGSILAPYTAPVPIVAPQSTLVAGANVVASSARLLAPSIAQAAPERPPTAVYYGVGASGPILIPSIAPPVAERPYSALETPPTQPPVATLLAPHVAPVTADAPASHLLAGTVPLSAPILALENFPPPSPERPYIAVLTGTAAAPVVLITTIQVPATAPPSSLVTPQPVQSKAVILPHVAPDSPLRPYSALLAGATLKTAGSIVPVPPMATPPPGVVTLLAGSAPVSAGSFLYPRIAQPVPLAPFSYIYGGGFLPVVHLDYVWMPSTTPAQLAMDATSPIQVPVMVPSSPVQIVILPPTRPVS